MSNLRPLEAAKALHDELIWVAQHHRYDGLQTLEQLLEEHTEAFRKLLDKPPRDPRSRSAVASGKITIDDEEYTINEDFVNDTLKLADELELDELEAARLLLDAQAEGDPESLDRSLVECGMLRFHLQRSNVLDSMRLCIQIANDENLDPGLQDGFGAIVNEKIYGLPAPGSQARSTGEKIVPRCMAAMQGIKSWLQQIGDKMAAYNVFTQVNLTKPHEFEETIEFSRRSLVEQHEILAVIMYSAVEKRHVDVKDFQEFIKILKKSEKYDHLLVHLFPVLGAYITVFGSTEGFGDLQQARQLHEIICKQSDDDSWLMPYLGAAVRAWWIAEYSGWYSDDAAGFDLQGVDLDRELEERTKQFMDALKDGAFDFILSVTADCKVQDWQDPTRSGVRQWLQRKSPPLASDHFPFHDFFQLCLMTQLEVFIDALISNMPDVLRRLRTEEDEQRQLSQSHEQDLDLERFLIIIAYAYEGRPEAAMSFWEDPDSNLAGFLQWASRRASTPLVSAFCEMLRSLSDNEQCATAAHTFLLEENHHSSGKMKRSQSLTWSQIFKELDFFTAKVRERPTPAQSHIYRPGKPSGDQAETEPESAMMLECYLRLIAKLTSNSEAAKQALLADEELHLINTLFRLVSGVIPARLRACAFSVLRALLSRKTQAHNDVMWSFVDAWMTGSFAQPGSNRSAAQAQAQAQNRNPLLLMETTLDEISEGFEEPNAFIQLLGCLVEPIEDCEPLHDTLPFPEDLGASVRVPGIDVYVDYVLGHVFAHKSRDIHDATQLSILRLSCLEFALACLSTFNEDLIVLGNQTNIAIDAAISTSDLAAYVRLHPFARVMEWMFNDKVVTALMSTIHQESSVLSSVAHDSPHIQSVLRGIEVMIKVLELQDTYLHLVRPAIKMQSEQRRPSVANPAYASFEDGIMNHLNLVVDLGRYCGVKYPPLTLACLKLLEKISTSSEIISAWNPTTGRHGHRNKAIVQLEKDSEGDAIAATLSADVAEPLDPVAEAENDNYTIKLSILDFLYECLKATPDQPTIAHLLLGFRCELNKLTIEPRGAFDSQKSLFHNLLNAFIGISVFQEERGMRGYLIALRYRIMRVFQLLWASPLSSGLVMEELRATNFLFHMLLREIQIEPQLKWDDFEANSPEFLLTNASLAYIDFLGTRAMAFEYICKELCSVSQNRVPMVKRQIFDALNGQIKPDGIEPLQIPNIFDFFDFLTLDGWEAPEPNFVYHKDLDLSACTEDDPVTGLMYNTTKVKEFLHLKRNEARSTGQVIPQNALSEIEREEALIIEYLVFTNRQRQLAAVRLRLLRAWCNLLLVMFESNDLKGSAQVAFLLQALQAILPVLEAFSTVSPAEAYELARVAKVLLFKLDFSADTKEEQTTSGKDKESKESKENNSLTIGNLISDKLFQLFQVCLTAIGRWAGSAELRAVYYSICYRYLTGVVDRQDNTTTVAVPDDHHRSLVIQGRRNKTLKAIQLYGERLLNVICDDAYGSDPECQTAAMILLCALVHVGRADDDALVVESLNKLNFIGVLVDSLKTILADWLAIISAQLPDNVGQGGVEALEQYTNAKLALLLQLCQTRVGAKYVLQANLFSVLEQSGVFSADPELEIDVTNTRALEKHYSLLVYLARIVGAAVLARGSHNVLQGRKFLSQHRLLVVHTLKRSAGIGTVGNAGNSNTVRKNISSAGGVQDKETLKAQQQLEERIEELAEAFMLLISATGFLEFETDTQTTTEKSRPTPVLFH